MIHFTIVNVITIIFPKELSNSKVLKNNNELKGLSYKYNKPRIKKFELKKINRIFGI